MDTNKLIELITKEVMSRIKDLEINSEEKRAKILILDSKENESYKALSNKLSNLKYHVDSLDSMENIDDYESIIVNTLNNRELANLAIGVQCGVKENIVIDSILKGKRICILEDGIQYRKYVNTANKVFFKLYQQYETNLINYGITIIKLENVENFLEDKKLNIKDEDEIIQLANCEDKEEKELKSVEIKNKKLISERDLKSAFKKGTKEIVVSKGAIVTPLAKDFIRVNHLVVNRL